MSEDKTNDLHCTFDPTRDHIVFGEYDAEAKKWTFGLQEGWIMIPANIFPALVEISKNGGLYPYEIVTSQQQGNYFLVAIGEWGTVAKQIAQWKQNAKPKPTRKYNRKKDK